MLLNLNNKLMKRLLLVPSQLIRKKMIKTAKEGIRLQATKSQIYGKMQEVFLEMDQGGHVRQHTYMHA